MWRHWGDRKALCQHVTSLCEPSAPFLEHQLCVVYRIVSFRLCYFPSALLLWRKRRGYFSHFTDIGILDPEGLGWLPRVTQGGGGAGLGLGLGSPRIPGLGFPWLLPHLASRVCACAYVSTTKFL